MLGCGMMDRARRARGGTSKLSESRQQGNGLTYGHAPCDGELVNPEQELACQHFVHSLS
jgi:hypothetical protein